MLEPTKHKVKERNETRNYVCTRMQVIYVLS